MHRFFILSLVFICLLISCQTETSTQLRIATSANAQFVMKELINSYKEESGINCEMIVGSSGQLSAQIRSSAPFDLFFSADMKYPKFLADAGLALEAPEVYAIGSLVCWSLSQEIETGSWDSFTYSKVKHIAIADPELAPYGKAAKQALEYYQIYDSVQSKLVFGQSISQTNQYIISGAAEVGFTARSVVVSPQMKEEGHWTPVPEDAYKAIEQGAIILKSTSLEIQARSFMDFLKTEKARSIFIDYGYNLP